MHWLNRILLAMLVAAAVALGPGGFESAAASDDLQRVRTEREDLRRRNGELREKIRLLRAEVQALQDDPQEIARIAREDLNLVAPGEVVFAVERVGSTPRRAAPPR